MHRDMTRGSITRGLLLFALPMAAGDPCGAGLCAGGAGGRQRHLGRYPYRPVSGGRRGIRLLLPPAQSAAPRGERRLIRGIKKSGASPMELHPICWTVWYTVQQMGCVYMPKGIPQNQIKTKRPEPCAVQDSDRSGRLFLFLSNFWGSLPCGCGSFIILLLQGFSLHVFKGRFSSASPSCLCSCFCSTGISLAISMGFAT